MIILINKVKIERQEQIKKIPILHKKEVINVSVREYRESVKDRLEKCDDFDSRRQFLLNYVKKIEFCDNEVKIYGSVPVRLKAYEDVDQPSDVGMIGFCVEGEIGK